MSLLTYGPKCQKKKSSIQLNMHASTAKLELKLTKDVLHVMYPTVISSNAAALSQSAAFRCSNTEAKYTRGL